MAGDAAAAAGQPARIRPAPVDFQEWLAKHDGIVESSPEKSEVSATSPIFLDSHVLRLHDKDQLDDSSGDGGQVELPQRSNDDGRDKGNDDDLIAIDWNLDAFDMSDKLCEEIQSAVDAATTRLATEKEPPLLPLSSSSSPTSSPDLVLIMEVVIGDGRTETIHVHEGDSPETLASAFASAHNLEPDVVPTLVQHIHDQIQRMDASSSATCDALGRKTPSSNQAERHYNALLDKFGKKNKANAAASSRRMSIASSSLDHGGGKQLGSKARASRTSSVASERLYALAAAQREWLERAQKKKQDEVERELHDNKVRLADKTKQLVANRTNGQYRSIGDRLHGEALVDHAKRQQQHENHAAELALGPLDVDKDWMCPKCAFMNRIVDATCQNTFIKGKLSKASPSKSAASKPNLQQSSIKRKSATKTAASQASPPSICGQPKPTLFHPTLVSKESKKPSQDDQFVFWRQRHKQAAQAEYAQRHPFTPQVNPTSTELVKDKRPSNPHAALYADADARRERHHIQVNNYMAQFPFRPDIGVNTFVPPSAKPDELFYKLAIQDRDKLEATRAKLHAKYSAAKDPATGRPYFKPETGRSPQFARNDTGLPIGEFLYNSRREFDQVHRQLRHAHMTSLKEERSQSFMSKASRTHLKQRKAKSFDRILTLLQDASASTATVAKDDNVLDPRLLDMDALSLELGHVALSLFDTCGWVPIAKDNFHTSMDATLAQCRHLTNTQVLFFSDKSSAGASSQRTTAERLEAQNDAEMTFRPAICAKSTTIMKQQARDATKVFDTMFKYHETYNSKRKQLEKQLQAEAAKTCTFRPKVNATSGKFQDMYARLPEDFDQDHDAAVVLSTAKPYSRPYVRPIGNSPTPSSASSDATN